MHRVHRRHVAAILNEIVGSQLTVLRLTQEDEPCCETKFEFDGNDLLTKITAVGRLEFENTTKLAVFEIIITMNHGNLGNEDAEWLVMILQHKYGYCDRALDNSIFYVRITL